MKFDFFFIKKNLYYGFSLIFVLFIYFTSVHVVLVVFVYLVYTGSGELGSPSEIYNRLVEVASKSRICEQPVSHYGQSCGPVSGNYKGSYVTMLSSGGLVFGIINIIGNFGTVFVDNVRLLLTGCKSISLCFHFGI